MRSFKVCTDTLSSFLCLSASKSTCFPHRFQASTRMATTRKHSVTVIDENAIGVTSVFARRGDHAVLEEGATKDEQNLGALGYKQEFKR